MKKENSEAQSPPPYPTFRLGIILAGAVSAGAYTAGVMDYLLNCLCEWDKLKEKNKDILRSVNWDWSEARQMEAEGFREDIPMHNVVIEILAGASAGGMSAGIVLSSLFKGFQSADKTNSLLYDAWVNLNETEKNGKVVKDVFTKMLEKDDLEFLTTDAIKAYWENNNETARDKKKKFTVLEGGAVSYTHLTLPTILLV